MNWVVLSITTSSLSFYSQHIIKHCSSSKPSTREEKRRSNNKSHGESLMEEEICLVDSCIINAILKETKYFQTLTRMSENVLTIAGRNVTIVATITFPNGTQVTIKDALLYPDSTRTLINFRDI
jgi:hypothetical protein